jgi:hypothetical protein
MKNLIWNSKVFYHLLFLSLLLLSYILIICLLFNEKITLVSIIMFLIGIVIGVIISFYEKLIFHKKNNAIFHPTFLPYLVFYSFLILNIFIKSYRVYLGFIIVGYLLSLGIAIRIYEKKSGRIGITWNNLLVQKTKRK